MSDKPLRLLVVGGGITGLTAAHRLQKRLQEMSRKFEIVLVESSNRLGGLIHTVRQDGYMLEEGPDCFLKDKPRGLAFCQEIGLEPELIETQLEARHAGVWRHNRLIPIPKGFQLIAPTDLSAMLMSSALSLSGKWQMLRDFWCPASTQLDETVGAFVRRRFGTEVLERFAQPLVAGIYGADPDQLSLKSAFPKLAEKDRKGSFFKQGNDKTQVEQTAATRTARTSLFASFKEGMATLVHQLGGQMTHVGARLNTSVRTLTGSENGWNVFFSNGEEMEVDGVCLAVSAPTLATIVMDMDPELYKLLMKITYSDSVAVHFALNEKDIQAKLEGSGFVVPLVEKKALSACTFVHRKFAGRAPAGGALLRAFSAGRAALALKNLSDQEVEKRLWKELKTILKIKGEPLFADLKRYRQALPQYIPGHTDRMNAISDHLSALPGLAMAGNWNNGVGIPDCIEAGERAADRLISDLCTDF